MKRAIVAVVLLWSWAACAAGRQLLQSDLDLNGNTVVGFQFNAKAMGRLKGDGVQNVVPLLPSLENRALGAGTDAGMEFPAGRYVLGSGFASSKQVTYVAQRGAVFVVPTGVTVTLERFEAGPWATFEVATGATLIIHTTSRFYPQWFGAIGDGVHDDTAAIQRAFDVLAMTSISTGAYGLGPGDLLFPSGSYKITNTVTLTRGVGVRIRGVAYLTTRLVWAGSSGRPMIVLYNARNVTLSDLSIYGVSSARPSYLVEVRGDKNDPALYFVPGRCQFRDLVLSVAEVGLAYTYAEGTGPAPPNNDQGHFTNVEVANVTEAGIQFGTEALNSANAKSFRFDNCVLTGGRFGVKTYHASYYWRGGYVGQHQPTGPGDTDGGVDFWFWTAPSDSIRIDDADSEGSARFLVVGYPAWLGQAMPIVVTACRVSTSALAADGILIHTTTPGPIVFSGNRLGEIGWPIPSMRHECQTGDVGTQGGYFLYEGNAFDALNLQTGDGSYDHVAATVTGPCSLVMRGNTYRKMGPGPRYDWQVWTKAAELPPQ